jgi:hypothetical protein
LRVKLEEEKDYVEHLSEIKSSEKPHIPMKKAIKLLMKKGETYYYCTCGLS